MTGCQRIDLEKLNNVRKLFSIKDVPGPKGYKAQMWEVDLQY